MFNKIKMKHIVFVGIVFFYFILAHLFHFENFVSPDYVRKYVDSFGIWSPVVFVALYILCSLLFVPSTPFILASGVLFGPFRGFIYVMIGSLVVAFISFYAVRFFGEGAVRKILKDNYKDLYKYDKKIQKRGVWSVFLLRLLPVPFMVMNVALGLTQIRTSHYMVGTMLGIIPTSFLFVFLGESFIQLNVYYAIVISILFILISMIIYRKNRALYSSVEL